MIKSTKNYMGAELYLNRNKHFELKTDDVRVQTGKLRSSFTDVLEKMVPNDDLQNKIDDLALEFEIWGPKG
jgi:hypothetical protein